MLQLLSKLTGYDSNLNFFTPSEILKEANRKFAHTWVIIDGDIWYVEQFYDSYIKVYTDSENTDDLFNVTSIEAWMPEPGIYAINEDLQIFLHRIPRRQWLKSFSPYNNFIFNSINEKNKPDDLRHDHIKYIFNDWKVNKHRDRNWLIKLNCVIYKFHVVGITTSNILTVIDEAFYQEITEKWSKHYNIILEKAHQDPAVDAN